MGPFDDSPEYKRLKQLREAGYDGPVDQDGRPAPVTVTFHAPVGEVHIGGTYGPITFIEED
ncbi:hypothetical protein [Streptosporangium saharense]|uniref:Uncharacterized protein n=1 Tax=Streptosporangium saharense TaxID=1706840 RepID=A0A7W7VSR1_9ACTN|nr:hypothetical protein [Streptosporangium saharense]MBB4920998.1 hypothetical protein [Streptosporangium saharense]